MKALFVISAFAFLAPLAPLPAQTLGGCSMFPANNIWNTPIDTLPVSTNSAAWINSIGPSTGLHPDFGSGTWDGAPIGIPYVLVPGTQTKVAVTFDYAGESDPGPYPVPANAPIEGGSSSGGDRHVLVVDTTNCILYELYAAYSQTDGSWQAGSGAVFDLKGNALRPAGWTSADAAGLPILPGLVRYDEILAGQINHAIRFTVQNSQDTYLWPARHEASNKTSTSLPPMGARFRLKSTFNVSTFPSEVQIILNAMKKYGIIVADNGSNWFISGVPDERWSNDNLHLLGNVTGSNFEAVDESGLMINVNSAQAAVATGVSLNGVTLSPATVTGGQTTTQNSVTLLGAAPAGGALVTLTSSDPAAATVPPTVTIAASASSAAFTITTHSVAAQEQVTISAGYSGTVKTATLTVTTNSLTGVSVSPASVIGATSAQGTATIGGPAPTGGAVVLLGSSSAAATVPASVTIAAGATSATFTIATSAVAASAPATISASYGGITKTATLTVLPAPLTGVSVSPASVTGGTSAVGTATLGGPAPAGGASVLLGSNSAAATVPASVTIAAGATSATFTVSSHAVAASTPATLTASYGGASKTATLTVLPAALTGVSVAPASVTGGTSVVGTATLGGPAPTGGAVVLLSSNSAAATVPASVTIAAGATSATFAVATSAVTASTQATISASYGGTGKTATLTVLPATITSALTGVSVSPTSVVGGSTVHGTIKLNGPAPDGGAVITLRSSSTTATVPTTVTIPAGATSAMFTVSTKQGNSTTRVTISASYSGVTKSAVLTLTALHRVPIAPPRRLAMQ